MLIILNTKEEEEVWHYMLRPKMSSWISDLARNLFWIYQVWAELRSYLRSISPHGSALFNCWTAGWVLISVWHYRFLQKAVRTFRFLRSHAKKCGKTRWIMARLQSCSLGRCRAVFGKITLEMFDISGYPCGGYVRYRVLGHDVVPYGRNLPTFRRIELYDVTCQIR
jgi:hypothetical protein